MGTVRNTFRAIRRAPSLLSTQCFPVNGRPAEIQISEAEVAEALAEPVSQILSAVMNALEQTPPELSSDIIDEGITITGGGGLLSRIDIAIAEATGLQTQVADDALICVAMGAGQAFENPIYSGVLINS